MTKKSFFSILAAGLFLVAAFAQQANASCTDKHGKTLRPAAVADGNGDVFARTPTGKSLHVGGLPPFAEVCRNLLFETASKKCPNGEAVLDAPRPARDCKYHVEGDIGCVHITCLGGG